MNFLRHHDELSLIWLDQASRETLLDTWAPHPNMRIYGRGTRRRLARCSATLRAFAWP